MDMKEVREYQGITMYVERKLVKRISIRLLPAENRIHVSVPLRYSEKEVERFILEHIEWIREKSQTYGMDCSENSIKYQDGEKHFLWGKPYILRLQKEKPIEGCEDSPPKIVVQNGQIWMYIPENMSLAQREALLYGWYEKELRKAMEELIPDCEAIAGIHCKTWRIRNMHTRWGSCTPGKKSIRLNLQLAMREPVCLKYVIFHELTHFYEENHSEKFWDKLESYYPAWREGHQLLKKPLL